MKRKNNLYTNICNIFNISQALEEVCLHLKNINRVALLKSSKAIYVSTIYELLTNRNYTPGATNSFIIKEPKMRLVTSLQPLDKIINNLVARHILIPAISPRLLDINVASRKNLGTSAGIALFKKYNHTYKAKYKTYYVLKCDIKSFFASIDHDILKHKLTRIIKDKYALEIVFKIIDSNATGLNIGSMTSQLLAIFYLNDLDHYIKENLKIKCYVRYQDDFLLFHESKQYLQMCLKKIQAFLEKEGLTLNSKTRIYKNTDNFTFLGRNTKYNYTRYRSVYRKLKLRYKLYCKKEISLYSLISSIKCYSSLCGNKNIEKVIKNITKKQLKNNLK